MTYRLERAFPSLLIIPIENVRPGQIVWGWERDANYSRKGWYVEPEGEMLHTAEEMDDRWVFNQTHVLKGSLCPRYALIEEKA